MKRRPDVVWLAIWTLAAASGSSALVLRSANNSSAVVLRARDGNREHVCPVQLPTRTEDTYQKPYFDKLHAALVHGNGVLEGCLNESSQEHYVKEFADELQCLYAIMLDNRCGGLESKHASRQEKWEKACLDPNTHLVDATALMDQEEKLYFQRLTKQASERQIYATYLKLAGKKELVCILMKTIDDECLAFASPRLLPPSHQQKDNAKK